MRLEQTNKEVEDPLQESRTISEPMLPCQSTTGKGRGTAPRVRKNKKNNKAQQKTNPPQPLKTGIDSTTGMKIEEDDVEY